MGRVVQLGELQPADNGFAQGNKENAFGWKDVTRP
jgi:hypothetical protein